jgi:hypothetical protein
MYVSHTSYTRYLHIRRMYNGNKTRRSHLQSLYSETARMKFWLKKHFRKNYHSTVHCRMMLFNSLSSWLNDRSPASQTFIFAAHFSVHLMRNSTKYQIAYCWEIALTIKCQKMRISPIKSWNSFVTAPSYPTRMAGTRCSALCTLAPTITRATSWKWM